MKRELWTSVKTGDYVILADEYKGVFRAKVIQTDIRIYEPGSPSRWGHPYGLTAEAGTVEIEYDGDTKIENLANLVRYSSARLARLRRDWNSWQRWVATSNSYRETYLGRIQTYREL